MNSQPNKYQEQIMSILTKVSTKMWVFYRPALDARNTKDDTGTNNPVPSGSGFRIIHGNFLISFR